MTHSWRFSFPQTWSSLGSDMEKTHRAHGHLPHHMGRQLPGSPCCSLTHSISLNHITLLISGGFLGGTCLVLHLGTAQAYGPGARSMSPPTSCGSGSPSLPFKSSSFSPPGPGETLQHLPLNNSPQARLLTPRTILAHS